MENLLRKRLAFIKNRARQLRKQYLTGRPTPVHSRDEPPCRLDEAAPGEERRIESLPFYVVRTMGEHIVEDSSEVADRFLQFCKDSSYRKALGRGRPGHEALPPPFGEEFCFFDIETTGLSPNTYVFLCGMMTVEDGRFVIDQAFARDYSEESGILRYVRDTFRRYSVLVTFNGASFDVPFVKTRMRVARIDYEGPPEHIDLLPRARPFFGGVLPNCRLETIERHLRGTERTGDIPGRDIPEAYHEFVRTGDACSIKRILYHNRMDLLAMAYLFNHIAAGR